MKNWYEWFYFTIGYAIVGVINYFNKKEIISAIVLASLAVAFGFIQFLCDRKGEKGKKAFKYISVTAIILLIIWIIYVFAVYGLHFRYN